jgi:hypothetical protein
MIRLQRDAFTSQKISKAMFEKEQTLPQTIAIP